MISLEDVIAIHNESIKRFGGSLGIRDSGALESALKRLSHSFEGEDFYPSPIEKAAAAMESLIVNHPFVDGNKRTGFIVGGLFLEKFGFAIIGSEEDNYSFVIAIASGKMRFDEIVEWLKSHTQSIKY